MKKKLAEVNVCLGDGKPVNLGDVRFGGAVLGIEEIKAEALKLSPEARATLARELLASLDSIDAGQMEKLWLDEAVRRDKELDAGTARAFPADEVLRRAKERLK